MNIIKQITKYPIKGLSGHNLESVFLEKNAKFVRSPWRSEEG